MSDLISTGIDQFYQGLFDESIASMKQAVEEYPDSTLTKLAIDYLYYATRITSEDYTTLRNYLDLNISSDNLATYIKKEEIKTKCLIKEEDYQTAISRLQLIIDNPSSVADSLYALIDQAYCYMSLVMNGAKALPNISIKTPDFKSYIGLLASVSDQIAGAYANQSVITPSLKIQSNYPNPFNPSTTILCSIPVEGKVRVAVYNLKGQKVSELFNGVLNAGNHNFVWNGTDSNGRAVSSGIYFTRIESGKQKRIHKLMLMK